eukprot:15366859-Ditylum_brightwellii.AAC.2
MDSNAQLPMMLFQICVEQQAWRGKHHGNTKHNKTTRQFLQEMAPIPHDPAKIDTQITTKQVWGGFKIWKDAITTSPQG